MLHLRFTTQLSVLIALTSSLTVVTPKPLNQFKPRLQSDVCAEVNEELSVSGLSLGNVNLCACVSGIPSLISSGPTAIRQAVTLFGAQAVTKSLNNLITGASGSEQCQYPDNAVAVCQSANPCGFQCVDGFVPSPSTGKATSCICPYPYTVCNGQCGSYTSCYSGAPSVRKRDVGSDCAPGWKRCQIPGREVMECVDVLNDLWSCGGCEVPFGENEPAGVDCTAIPNVAGVSCLDGICTIGSCARGFLLNEDQTSCARMNTTTAQYPVLVQNGRGSY